jgi:hypothetical protein
VSHILIGVIQVQCLNETSFPPFPLIVQKVMKLECRKKCTVLEGTGILKVNEN